MQGTLQADKNCYMFDFESFEDFDMITWSQCGCGCNLYQLFGFFYDCEGSYRVDLLRRDDYREMVE